MRTLSDTINLRWLRTVWAPGGGPARGDAPAENVLCISGPQSKAELLALLDHLKGMAEDESVRMVFLNSQQDVSKQFGPRQKTAPSISPGGIGDLILAGAGGNNP